MVPIIKYKKLFDLMCKKYRGITFVILSVFFSLFVQFTYFTFIKYTSAVDLIQDAAILNRSKIEAMEFDFETQIKTGLVTRKSFNDYIRRKDDEYHKQMAINNYFFNKIGYVEGILSKDNGIKNANAKVQLK